MALRDLGEKLHMMKDITNHTKQDYSVVIARVSLLDVLERQETIPSQGAKNNEEATM